MKLKRKTEDTTKPKIKVDKQQLDNNLEQKINSKLNSYKTKGGSYLEPEYLYFNNQPTIGFTNITKSWLTKISFYSIENSELESLRLYLELNEKDLISFSNLLKIRDIHIKDSNYLNLEKKEFLKELLTKYWIKFKEDSIKNENLKEDEITHIINTCISEAKVRTDKFFKPFEEDLLLLNDKTLENNYDNSKQNIQTIKEKEINKFLDRDYNYTPLKETFSFNNYSNHYDNSSPSFWLIAAIANKDNDQLDTFEIVGSKFGDVALTALPLAVVGWGVLWLPFWITGGILAAWVSLYPNIKRGILVLKDSAKSLFYKSKKINEFKSIKGDIYSNQKYQNILNDLKKNIEFAREIYYNTILTELFLSKFQDKTPLFKTINFDSYKNKINIVENDIGYCLNNQNRGKKSLIDKIEAFSIIDISSSWLLEKEKQEQSKEFTDLIMTLKDNNFLMVEKLKEFKNKYLNFVDDSMLDKSQELNQKKLLETMSSKLKESPNNEFLKNNMIISIKNMKNLCLVDY